MFVRIGIIQPFCIENGYGGWQYIIGYVMIADNEINTSFAGICNFINGFDAAVEYDYQADTGVGGIIHSLARNPVTFVVTVGDVIV